MFDDIIYTQPPASENNRKPRGKFERQEILYFLILDINV